jgi:hypothetical protein
MTIRQPSHSYQWVPPLIVLVSSLVILAVVNPHLVLSSSTPAGGDMGAHVFGPAFMRDVLIPDFRLHGWSNDWFAGFPLYYFYFPLPALLIVLLDVFLPYGVAFKIVAISGLLLLPPAAFTFARSMRLDRVACSLAAAATVPFMLMESFKIYGGNVASTMAGEYAYVLSFSLGFFYLAALIKALRDDRHWAPVAAALLAATALSHVLTTIVLVVASLVVIASRKQLRLAAGIGALGFMVTAFWSVPFVTRIKYSTDMAWVPLRSWDQVFPIEIWLLLPLAAVGAVYLARRTQRAMPLIVVTLVPVIYYPLPPLLIDLFPETFGDIHWKLWNGRLLPYWYFGVTMLAAIGVAAGLNAIARRLPDRLSAWLIPIAIAVVGGVGVVALTRPSLADRVPKGAPLGAAIAVVVLVGMYVVAVRLLPGWTVSSRSVLSGVTASLLILGSLGAMNFASGWARWNFQGYEGKSAYPEYRGLMETINRLPAGRVMWEHNREAVDQYGTSMALMLIPYWAGSDYPSMEGLFFESSLTVPFHFLNQAEMSFKPSQPVPGLAYRPFDFDRGIPHLQTYGVRYYVCITEEAKAKAGADPRLRLITESAPFQIYELVDYRPPVEVADHEISVLAPSVTGEPFGEAALEWYGELELLDKWLVADGPDEWRQIEAVPDVAGARPITTDGTVSAIVIGEEEISFRTSAIGVPHMVKVSFFPNWTAEGADGPFRAAPSTMIVVPTEEQVVIRFENTWVEATGNTLTIAGLAVVGGWWWTTRRRKATESVA